MRLLNLNQLCASNMSYQIVFKGQIAPEFIDETSGRVIAAKWEQGTLTGRVVLNENIYEASAIKAILKGFQNPDHTKKNEDNAKLIMQISRDSEDYFARKQKRPSEERAKDTSLSEVLYVAAAGKKMPEEVKVKVRERQLAFFKEHDNFAEAKPTCYKDLIPQRAITKDAAPSIGDLLSINTLHFAERVVSNGIQPV